MALAIPGQAGMGPPGMPPPGMPGLAPVPPPPPPQEDDQAFVRRVRLVYMDRVTREHQKIDLLEGGLFGGTAEALGKPTPAWVFSMATMMPYIACGAFSVAAIFIVLMYGIKFAPIQEQFWYYACTIGLGMVTCLLDMIRIAILTIVELRKFEIRKRAKDGEFRVRRVQAKEDEDAAGGLSAIFKARPKPPAPKTAPIPKVAPKFSANTPSFLGADSMGGPGPPGMGGLPVAPPPPPPLRGPGGNTPPGSSGGGGPPPPPPPPPRSPGGASTGGFNVPPIKLEGRGSLSGRGTPTSGRSGRGLLPGRMDEPPGPPGAMPSPGGLSQSLTEKVRAQRLSSSGTPPPPPPPGAPPSPGHSERSFSGTGGVGRAPPPPPRRTPPGTPGRGVPASPAHSHRSQGSGGPRPPPPPGAPPGSGGSTRASLRAQQMG